MSLVGQIYKCLGAHCRFRVHQADSSGIFWHDDASDNDALQIVLATIQRALGRVVRKSKARTEVFDARQPRNVDVLHCNRLGQRSRHNNHNAPPVLIPEGFPARAGVSVESSSLANKIVAASRQFRDRVGFPTPAQEAAE